MTVKELEEKIEADAKAKWRKSFQMVRDRIKALSAEQVKDKAIMRLPNNGRGSPELKARVAELKQLYYDPQFASHCRAITITAALNLHHEMRGSNHRHVIRDHWDSCQLAHALQRLREEITEECAST